MGEDFTCEQGTIKIPKTVAKITLCGCINIEINDRMPFKVPTEEQIKNLRDMLCIDVELL